MKPLLILIVAFFFFPVDGFTQNGIEKYSPLPPPTFAISPSNQNVSAEAGKTYFATTSNTGWSTSCNAPWCTVTPSFGGGVDPVKAVYTANPLVIERVAVITVSVMGMGGHAVKVTQAGAAPVLSVSPGNINVSFPAGSVIFAVASTLTWTVSCNDSWCTFTQSGSGNDTLQVDYEQNTTGQPRTATLEVSADTLPVQTVTVTQARSSTGMNEFSDESFLIGPNPTGGPVRIVRSSATGVPLEVTARDMSGRMIFRKNLTVEKECDLDFTNAPQGCYLLKIRSTEQVTVRKIIIIR